MVDVSGPQVALQVFKKNLNYLFLSSYSYSSSYFLNSKNDPINVWCKYCSILSFKESEVPLIFMEASTATYMKPNVEPDQILPWFKQYMVRPSP